MMTCRERMGRLMALAVFQLPTLTVFAALEPVSPAGGQRVQIVPDAQKKVMSLPTLEERISFFAEDRRTGKKICHDKYWRKSLPLVLKVRTTAGENGPWKVQIGKRADLSDARTWYLKTTKTNAATGREDAAVAGGEIAEIEVPRANLEVGTRYYWKISWRKLCGWGCCPTHGCKACKQTAETRVAEFVTEDALPRWIEIDGSVANFRDFGGRYGFAGRRVRQGMIYRGQGLNSNSANGEAPGRNRLTVEDVKYLTETLGIKTDLDLRWPAETAGLAESPLGAGVKFIQHPSQCYRWIFDKGGKKTMAENFRVFCDRSNYPVYFHCIGGADRTGALAYVMNGVLGVSRRDAETDWESTFYPNIPDENPDPAYWCRESHFIDGLSKYGDPKTAWNECVVLYLKDCGVTDEEIKTFREIMLEEE